MKDTNKMDKFPFSHLPLPPALSLLPCLRHVAIFVLFEEFLIFTNSFSSILLAFFFFCAVMKWHNLKPAPEDLMKKRFFFIWYKDNIYINLFLTRKQIEHVWHLILARMEKVEVIPKK